MNLKTRIAFLLFGAVLLAAPAVHALTYYVAKSGDGGSNSNSCATAQTHTTGKLTIAAALVCAASGGHTIVVKDGTYAESWNDTIPSGTSAITPTTIKTYSGAGTVIIQPTSCTGTGNGVIYIAGKSNIFFDGLILDAVNCTSGPGLYINSSSGGAVSANIVFGNGEIKNAGTSAYLCTGTPRATGCWVYNSKIYGNGGGSQDHGIYLAGVNGVIEYNTVFNNTSHGVHQFHTSGGSHGNIIRFNRIFGNGSRCAIIGSGNNNLFHHNLCAENGTATQPLRIDASSPNNSQAYNNLFYSHASALSCIEIRALATNSKVRNNVCLSNSNNTVSNLGTGSTITPHIASNDNTLVIDAANWRFTPREGSSLIDGCEVIAGFSEGRYVGSAPDCGALESPVLASASVEDGDATTARFIFSVATQSIRDGVGLKGGTTSNWALVVAGVGATESGSSLTQTSRVNVTIGTVTNGQTITATYTRGTLTGNSCIGGALGGCHDAEVLTFTVPFCPTATPVCFSNNVAVAVATWTSIHFRQWNIYSPLDTPDWRRDEDAEGRVSAGGIIAITDVLGCTIEPCGTALFDLYADLNGGTDFVLTNDATTNKIAFLNAPFRSFLDGQQVADEIDGLTNPHGVYTPGQIIMKQRSFPTTLVEDSATMHMYWIKVDSTAVENSIFCVFKKRSGGVSISQTKTACFKVVARSGSN